MDKRLDLPAVLTEASPSGGARFVFIDLARLGRTDWWSGLKGLVKIVGCYLLAGAVLSVPRLIWRFETPIRVFEVEALALAATATWVGVRSATAGSQGRPFLSLVSPTLRLDLARVLLGGGLWFGSAALLVALWALVDPAGFLFVKPWLGWPTRPEVIVMGLACIALFPFQAAGEELIFRGWLTQTLGQFLRRRWLVTLIVAALFALAHRFLHGVLAFPYFAIWSLGPSALTLTDRRLELAIGVHAANNISTALFFMFVPSWPAQVPVLFSHSPVQWSHLVVLATQLGMIYLAARWLVGRRSWKPNCGETSACRDHRAEEDRRA